ncbi:MAG TPA: recombinase family protein [Pseudonocardiaceae bacterium]|nr:recombinase family protein [Pseudonocardiaceae bacterium]
MYSGDRERGGARGRRGRDGGGSGWVGQPAAIYCRISRARDEDQTGVDRQERLCREVAQRLGLVIAAGCVFVDNNRSAWQRNRCRPGWDGLLEVIRAGRVGHVLVYHPDRLMRQPRDLEELLTLSEEHEITLHGQANCRDLSDADDRFFLRIEVAHACRSSDDTSRRQRDAIEDRARAGRPHNAPRRPYGYASDGVTIIEREAVIVREIFARYLEGVPPRQIALDLGARGERTSMGNPWQPHTVRDLLKSRHVTGIRVFRRQDYGDGDWPVIIDRGTWSEVQDRRAYRAAAQDNRASRFYLLRGLVMCKKCGTHMAGNRCKEPSYMCTRHQKIGPAYCTRRINAKPLETFVCDAAVELLTNLDVTGAPRATTALSETDQAAISAEEAELAELKDMWTARELSTREYRAMRKTIEDRIDVLRRKTIVRPTAEVLNGLAGPGARASWEALAASGDAQRMNAVLRFLFAAVIIDEHQGTRGSFDYSRIDIEPNPL